MKLYSGPVSLFTAKVRIALAEKALPYERIEVGWSLKDRYLPHHPDVVALNPKAEVPVLVDGDVVVSDSTLILEYLEDRYPEPPLAPRDAGARARCRQLEAAADEIVFPHVWSLIDAGLYPAAEGDRDEARLADARAGLATEHERLDKELANRSYLVGEFGVADIATFIMVSAGAQLGAPVDERHDALHAWLARVGGRESVAQEMAGMQSVLAAALSG